MAAESVRAVQSFSFNGSQTRPTIPLSPPRFLGLRPPRSSSSSLTSSSLSHFFGNLRLASNSSKTSTLRRRNLSVLAMAADGMLLFPTHVQVSFFKRFMAAQFVEFEKR